MTVAAVIELYSGFCLTHIPFLRSRLLSPFKKSLLADANLATFKPELYFADMSITLKGRHSNNQRTFGRNFLVAQGEIIKKLRFVHDLKVIGDRF